MRNREREKRRQGGQTSYSAVRCGCVTSRTERGNEMGKFKVEDVDGRLL